MLQPDTLETEAHEARYWYRNCGLSVVSVIPLDELAQSCAPGRPDVIVEWLNTALADEFAERTTHVVRVGEEGEPWLEVRRGPGAYLARWPNQLDVVIPDEGSRLQVCKRGEVTDSVARLLLCQALSFVLAAHGREGLHASAVELNGEAIIIAGESGRGKSTLATALCQSGARLIADDLVSVRLDTAGHVVVDPSTTKTWLVREVAAAMSHTGGAELGREYKVAVDVGAPGTHSVPLGAVYLLRYRAGAPEVEHEMGWRDGVGAFLAAMFNLVVRTPARMETQFTIATHVAAHVPIRVLRWEPGPDAARDVANQIIGAMGAPRGEDTMTDITEAPQAAAPSPALEPEAFASRNGNGNGASQRRQLLDLLRAAGVTDVPDEPDEEPLLRTSQVAALLRSSDRTIRTWADAGKLKYIKTLGGRRLFPASGILHVMQQMQDNRGGEA